MDHGMGGVLHPVTNVLMKATPQPTSQSSAMAALQTMIEK
jgi:hypothetical protein